MCADMYALYRDIAANYMAEGAMYMYKMSLFLLRFYQILSISVLKYIAVGLGIIETVLDKEEQSPRAEGKEGSGADDD